MAASHSKHEPELEQQTVGNKNLTSAWQQPMQAQRRWSYPRYRGHVLHEPQWRPKMSTMVKLLAYLSNCNCSAGDLRAYTAGASSEQMCSQHRVYPTKAKRLCLYRQLTNLSDNQRASRALTLLCEFKTLVCYQSCERIAMSLAFATRHVLGFLCRRLTVWLNEVLPGTGPNGHLRISVPDPYDTMQTNSIQHALRGHNVVTFGCACACRPRHRSR